MPVNMNETGQPIHLQKKKYRERVAASRLRVGPSAGCAVERHKLTHRSLGTTLRTISERLLRRIHHLSWPQQASEVYPRSSVPAKNFPAVFFFFFKKRNVIQS